MSYVRYSRLLAYAFIAGLLFGCRGATGPTALPEAASSQSRIEIGQARDPIDKIKHIVIIIQTDRTVENLFFDYPGAGTVKYGFGSQGQKIPIQQVSLKTHWNFGVSAAQFLTDCNGKGPKRGQNCRMNGFPEEAYAYVPHDQIQPYFDIAKQYVLAAKMFASNFDMSTFISHQYIIAGTNPGGSVNNPPAAWGCPGGPTKMDELLPNRFIKPNAVFPCWGVNTLGRELDEKNISWAYYAMPISGGQGGPSCGSGQGPDVQKGVTGIWSAYQTIKYICQGPDWNKDIISPPDRFITDVASGNLRAVTWITPRFRDSDEPGNYSDTGPSWVASVVNAIGKSKFWDSTAIFIFWDGDGGWYDPVPPPYLDDDSLGFRVPLLIVSPYAKQGYVSQVRYEHGSILKFIEDRFGLARLARSDTRANSPATDCFDFSMPPRKFVPIKAKYPEEFFLHQPVDTTTPGTD